MVVEVYRADWVLGDQAWLGVCFLICKMNLGHVGRFRGISCSVLSKAQPLKGLKCLQVA